MLVLIRSGQQPPASTRSPGERRQIAFYWAGFVKLSSARTSVIMVDFIL